MADKYRRTVSFANPNQHRQSNPHSAKSYHVRSSSLPCVRSNPLLPQLRDEINELRSWHNSKPDPLASSTSRLIKGLSKLKSVLDTLDDVLQMPQTHESLSHRSDLVEDLLDNFLQFVDVFGIFQTSVLALKHDLAGARFAGRRRDDSKLAAQVKSQKKIGKEMAKLISTVRSIECPIVSIDGLDEVACVIRDVHVITGEVSAAVFEGVMKSLGPARRRSMSWAGLGFFKGDVDNGVGDVAKKMKELDLCVTGMEDGSERVFRSLICTRVSLLNILTHI